MNILRKKIPYIFDYPENSDISIGILSSIFLVFFAIIWIFISDYFERGFFYLISFFILLIHYLIIIKFSRNILFIFRYSLISIIGLGASLAWSFSGDFYIAPFGREFQNHQSTVALIGCILLGLSGTSLAWFTSFRMNKMINNSLIILPDNSKFIKFLSKIICLFVAFIFIYISGFISVSNLYASNERSVPLSFGAFNAVLFTFSSIYFILSNLDNTKKYYIFIFITLIYILPILTGGRADYLFQLLIFLFSIIFSNVGSKKNKVNYSISLFTFGIIITYIVANILGEWRARADIFLAIKIFFNTFSLFVDRPSGQIFYLETANMAAGTFYSVYAKIYDFNESLLYGSSYFDYIFRTPPAFMGLPRPQTLAWDVSFIDNQRMSQGGIFELSEAFFNFWYFGAFLIPYILTRFFGFILKKALIGGKNWFFYAVLFMSLMLLAPRAVWYQTFAYWRVLTVVIIFFFIGKLMIALLKKK